MGYIVFITISVIVVVFGFILAKPIIKQTSTNIISHQPDSTQWDTVATLEIKGAYSRVDIRKKLEAIANQPRPENLELRGAMCYDMAAPPKRAEYICPHCGEKTLYVDDMAVVVQSDLFSCRNMMKDLEKKGLYIKLDESQFCKKCSPDAKEPVLCLDVKYYGEKTVNKTCDIHPVDLKLIGEFLDDKTVHKGDFDEETPMADHLDRIRKLLGI